MGRVLAIDYGDQRTGLALSDMTGLLTGEAVTVQEWDAERLAATGKLIGGRIRL